MNKITDRIWLGAWQPAANADLLRSYGISAVLNVAHDHNDPVLGLDFAQTKVGLHDSAGNPPLMIDLAVEALEQMILCGHKVYVHCISGIGRSPHVIAEFLARSQHRPYDDVYEEIRRIRPEVRFPNRLRRS